MTEARNRALVRIQKEDARNEELVIRNLMSTPSGRRWAWNFLSLCSLFAESEHLDPYRLAYEKGQRRVGHVLLRAITTVTPREYIVMTEEATSLSLTVPTTDQPYENDDD